MIWWFVACHVSADDDPTPVERPPEVINGSRTSKPVGQSRPCPSGLFSVDRGTGPNQPVVSARCSGDMMVVESNGLPTWDPPRITPNTMSTQRYSWKIPLQPEPARTPSEIPYLGPVGVTTTGVPIYAANEAADLGYGDAKLDNLLDQCGGHVGPNGDYHFHARPECPFGEADVPNNIIGYAFDGYPILQPWVCTDKPCTNLRKVRGSWHECVDERCDKVRVKKTRSSWQLKSPAIKAAWEKFGFVAGSGDLDQCNGMVGPDGSYAYYATDTFPYNVGCYYGKVDRQLNRLHQGWSQKDDRDSMMLPHPSDGHPPDGARPPDGPPPMGHPPHGRARPPGR